MYNNYSSKWHSNYRSVLYVAECDIVDSNNNMVCDELKDYNQYKYIAKDCMHCADKETASNMVTSPISLQLFQMAKHVFYIDIPLQESNYL